MHKSFLPANLDRASRVFAFVGVESISDLEETAKKLEQAVQGLRLVATDRFDEYPAFAGESSGLSFVLLGFPPREFDLRDEPDDSFELQISSIPPQKNRAEIDISPSLAKYLSEALGVRCWPLNA